jgi:hypothetical protein
MAKCKAVSTPREIAAAVETVERSGKRSRAFPMVFVPYLSEHQLRLLEAPGQTSQATALVHEA